ncbi:Eukaryotic translation initiation factor 3 subunit A, partial [Cichlidogyrus casuarinus]
MPPNYYLKPETALSKAKELIKVGKKQNALEMLYEMMKLKRGRVWHKNLQDLMVLFVDLCVELRKNIYFRKVIYLYKSMVVQECPQSMELVLDHYLSSIKKLTEEAHQKSKDAVLDIEDLDALDTPESLMLNAVTTEGVQDRSDKAILGPWLRFLWESYRLVLDLLRTMSKFEGFYYGIALEAYDFCIKYGRKNEFKKLTEALRVHSTRNQWQSNQQPPNPELQSLQIRIRMKQLDSAMDLEMYNDAFRAVEDIWGFFALSKKAGKSLVMKEYYTRISDLFFRSGSHLFHAAALLKLMNLSKEHKKTITIEEITTQASQVLCAILAIPLPQERLNFDKLLTSGESNAAKMKSLAVLLGLPTVPTRQTLIRDFLAFRVMNILPQELRKLFAVLETEFQPLKMYELIRPSLEFVKAQPELSSYLTNLEEVCIAKTVLQVSQVFRSIDFDHLCSLCPMVPPIKFERILVELIHNLELPIRIDHRNQ